MRTAQREKAAMATSGSEATAGLAGWLLGRLKAAQTRQAPKLALLERITLAPRQSLALVEAEGRRFLVATSQEGAPAFYALEERVRRVSAGPSRARVSW